MVRFGDLYRVMRAILTASHFHFLGLRIARSRGALDERIAQPDRTRPQFAYR